MFAVWSEKVDPIYFARPEAQREVGWLEGQSGYDGQHAGSPFLSIDPLIPDLGPMTDSSRGYQQFFAELKP